MEKKKYKAEIFIRLGFEIEADNRIEVVEELENIELPHGYVEDSFEIYKIEEIE